MPSTGEMVTLVVSPKRCFKASASWVDSPWFQVDAMSTDSSPSAFAFLTRSSRSCLPRAGAAGACAAAGADCAAGAAGAGFEAARRG